MEEETIKMNIKERNENMRQFFNRKIDSYDDTHQKFMPTKIDLIDSFYNGEEKILDLGVGTGLELIHLFDINKDVKVTAIDISEEMINKLKQRPFGYKVNALCGDFFELDFEGPYDAVISTSALHHFIKEDKLKLYKKIYECLKENGQFVNADKIALSNEEEKQLLDEYYMYKDEKAHCDTPLSCESEKEILEKAGFRDIEIKETDASNYRLIKARK